MSCVETWDFSPNAVPLVNSIVLVLWSLTFSASARWQIPWAPHIPQPDSHAACYFFFIYFSFSSGNHGHHVPTRCRLKKIGPPPHETLEASRPSGFCATFGPHMAAVANIWSLVAGNGEQMSGGCVFLFLCPQVFHYTAETLASRPFWRGRRCVFVRRSL